MHTPLEPLLRTMHRAPDFGSAFSLPPDDMDIYLQRTEAVRQYFIQKMGPLVVAGLPDWEESEREKFVSGAERWVAFSPGLAADMTPNVKRLGNMAVLTGLTAVVNGVLDKDDQAMPLAIRWFQHPYTAIVLHRRKDVRARSSILWNTMGKLISVAHPSDVPVLARIIGKDLYRDGKRIHELSVLYPQTRGNDKEAFLAENAEEITGLMIDTGAIQSVTAPLYSMLRRGNNALLSLKEVHGSDYVRRLLKLANTIIRVQDDAGDRERDADEHTFSLNLFNQPSEPLIRAFCHQVDMDNVVTERVVPAFSSADTPEKRHEIIQVFIEHFLMHVKNVPEKYSLYAKLVVRALAAGTANEVGDDKLARSAGAD